MLTLSNANGEFSLSCKMHNGMRYFKAKDVATCLKYANTTGAIIDHVYAEYRYRLKDITDNSDPLLLDGNAQNIVYIAEPGLYQLVAKCTLLIARYFQKWLWEEVLPSIRATGSYTLPQTVKKQIILKNETDLHYKVVDLI